MATIVSTSTWLTAFGRYASICESRSILRSASCSRSIVRVSGVAMPYSAILARSPWKRAGSR
ncbi:hypothetical protein BJF88_17530 [Cellulosimicrobium sp. CUA-896]|nr:hypothetical protein BJF88_17530 [Cellulosimicrobium sp. CUA-896]